MSETNPDPDPDTHAGLRSALDMAFNAAAPGHMRGYESERLKEAIVAELSGHTDTDAIKAAITKLPLQSVWALSAWLDEHQENLFDEAIERDAKSGALDKLAGIHRVRPRNIAD